MLEFAWPWVFAALPLPWLLRALLPPAETAAGSALKVPFFTRLAQFEAAAPTRKGRGQTLRQLPLILIWLLLLLAASRPQWLGEPVELPVSGRDLMLAVDLSGSMEQADMLLDGRAVDRLSAVKAVLKEFIQHREGDRLGLILFGSQAYLQTPLTFDRDTVQQMLMESLINLAGQKTAIGDAIGLAVKRLQQRPQENRVLILLTDGSNTAGEITPVKAAELAAQAGVKIYTVGVGAGLVKQRTLFGTRQINTARDLDETTLKAVAQATSGQYFRARDTQGLEAIYRHLDELEPVEVDTETFRPLQALYSWPLGLAFVLSLLVALRR